MEKTIFVVDDNAVNLLVAKETLKNIYRVRTLSSALKMFEMLKKVTPDIILLDIKMPEMDGFEALARLKRNKKTSGIPVIFLTSLNNPEAESKGFRMGVVDFISKPFSAPVLINRLEFHLNMDKIIRERTDQLLHKTTVLESLQGALVFTLADMVESRDANTGGHVTRTTMYVEILIEELLDSRVYADDMAGLDVDLMVLSSKLHDIGKISIPDYILNKPGPLTVEEFDIMKTHCAVGEKIINNIISRTEDVEFLNCAKTIASTHHERWDGTGYPNRLAGEDIPIQGRIASIVDVYDALVSERPYKKAFTHEKAVEIIASGAGTQFDPLIAKVFLASAHKFAEVKVEYNYWG